MRAVGIPVLWFSIYVFQLHGYCCQGFLTHIKMKVVNDQMILLQETDGIIVLSKNMIPALFKNTSYNNYV